MPHKSSRKDTTMYLSKLALLSLALVACGGRIEPEPVDSTPEPISQCSFGGSASGLIDPVKFCAEIPWVWLDGEGVQHSCTETCPTGNACHYVNDAYQIGPGTCVQPDH